VDYPKGSIQNPMTDDELQAKFEALAAPVVGRARASRIIDTAMNVERCSDIGKLMKLTASARRK
jgi:2-methylcitrate dehydratase PrpD